MANTTVDFNNLTYNNYETKFCNQNQLNYKKFFVSLPKIDFKKSEETSEEEEKKIGLINLVDNDQEDFG